MEEKLYLDEDVHPIVAEVLTGRGWDVATTCRAGNLGRSDEEQLAFAAAEQRIFLTFNVRDFVLLARKWTMENKSHSGIIVSSQLPVGELVRRIVACLDKNREIGFVNKLFWLHSYKL